MNDLKTTIRISSNRYDKVNFKDLKLKDKIYLFYSINDLNSIIDKEKSIIDYGIIKSKTDIMSISNSIFSINKINIRKKINSKNKLIIVRKNKILINEIALLIEPELKINDHVYLFDGNNEEIFLFKNKNYIGNFVVTEPLHKNHYNIECINIKKL